MEDTSHRMARFFGRAFSLPAALLFLLFLTACAAPTTAPVRSETPAAPPTETSQPLTSPTRFQTPRGTAESPVTPSPSPTPGFTLCSPLEGLPLESLVSLVSNPFHPPPPGSDDPHQGVDLADILPGTRMAVGGRAVQAVLPGWVAAVNPERFPYGRAVLLETALADLPPGWLARLGLPDPDPNPPPPISLTCPGGLDPLPGESRSLYILYAHLEDTAPLAPGDTVTCGQVLGSVGMSGNALNPHLHVEVRVGPSGWRFASMAHYDASASLEEMAAYCQWRVSGQFLLVDPMKLLGTMP